MLNRLDSSFIVLINNVEKRSTCLKIKQAVIKSPKDGVCFVSVFRCQLKACGLDHLTLQSYYTLKGCF